MKAKWFGTFLILAMLMIAIVPMAGAAPNAADGINNDPSSVSKKDNRPDPLTTAQLELKQKALDAKLNGKAHGKSHEVARGQYVELAREGQGMVWTVLGEFSDFPHNSIAEPDRTVNNTTYWVPDFSKAYFDELIYSQTPGVNSMANFYIEQSSNRYTIAGEATDWVTVPGLAASYDDGDPVGPSCGTCVWNFVKDSVNGWYDAQIAAGKTPAEINEYLSQFDVWDRYDYDGDGNFNEPDGYIDTFQSVHAGEGNEAGGGLLGDAAIWSHSWYAFN
jgi:immune inhibitor A